MSADLYPVASVLDYDVRVFAQLEACLLLQICGTGAQGQDQVANDRVVHRAEHWR